MVGRAGRRVDGAVRRDGARGEVLGLRGAALHVLEVRDRDGDDLLLESELQAAVRGPDLLFQLPEERVL